MHDYMSNSRWLFMLVWAWNKLMDLERRGKLWIYTWFLINWSDCKGGKRRQSLGFWHSIEQRTEKNCSLVLISNVPSPRKIPCSTSAWESSETRSDIAKSSPADRQFSYWPVGLWPSLVSASPSSSATRSASGDPVAWPACVAFLRILGGLFRKNLFCDERASWDKRLNFLDWLIWHDLATGRKQREREKKKTYENDGCRYVTVYDSLNTLKTGSRMQPAVSKLLKQNCER